MFCANIPKIKVQEQMEHYAITVQHQVQSRKSARWHRIVAVKGYDAGLTADHPTRYGSIADYLSSFKHKFNTITIPMT